ncbi:RepB family plasmid replication initiator protein [Lactococcus petauri]|uniref:RepB family plasmid replication initiator protein n=1 Tax=Lactococcus petauri TaxID=1940789 RepID=UPI003855537E
MNNKKNVSTIEKRKVVEHNDLISSVAKMDKTSLKIFEMAVSCIDTENPPKDNLVYLSKKELFKFFDVQDSDKHSRFKKAIVNLHRQSIFQIKELNDKKNKYEYRVISPLEETKWNDYSDIVNITFTKAIMPYLIDLKKNFTQYALSDIMGLNSKYSIILYKWLCMYYNQYEHYNEKGGRRESQIEEYRNPSISVQKLRELTDTVTEYSRFQSLETRVIKNPVFEINEHTHFNISYEKHKKGKAIDTIQFHIEKKKTALDVNGDYKKEQNDPTYIQSKEKNQQLIMLNSAKAMQSEYTKILLENNLLFPQDFMEVSIMAELQMSVYPLYDELKNQRGIQAIKKHLSYVSEKQEAYSKRNIAKYLKKAITQYLETL